MAQPADAARGLFPPVCTRDHDVAEVAAAAAATQTAARADILQYRGTSTNRGAVVGSPGPPCATALARLRGQYRPGGNPSPPKRTRIADH
jgi:hypothetical protein